MSRKLPEFDRPPLNEVAFGLQFEPLKNLHAAHLGVYWSRIRKRYPYTEEHINIAHMTERLDISILKAHEQEFGFDTLPTVPRCWFLDDTKLELMQVQQDRFLRNWRQIDGREPYPRFATLLEKFCTESTEFVSFLQEEAIGAPLFDQCELTYINQIPLGDGWTEPSDFAQVFTVWAGHPQAEFMPSPELASWRLSYGLPDGRGRLYIQMKQAIRGRDRRPILVLDLTARGAPKNQCLDGCTAWYHLAHEWIVRGFTDVTTPAMHKLWGRTK